MERKFEDVYKIDVSDKTEKKGNLTYLSWAYAWAEFKKVYPAANYEVKKFDGLPYVKDEKVGFMVYTSVTADGLTYEMWLPVMNSMNKAILNPTMFEINKTIMRCLAKNLAMFGLGLYIYAGEDLPEDGEGATTEQKLPNKKKKTAQSESKSTERRSRPITQSELVRVWGVKDPEATVSALEKRFGLPFIEWGTEETNAARVLLEKKKREKEGDSNFPS